MASKIKGAREMARVLRQLPREVQEKTVLTALRAGARVIQKAMEQKLAGEGVTGRSIAEAGGRVPRRLTVIERAPESTRRRPKVLLANHKAAFFLTFREFGTAPHRIAPGRGRRVLADVKTGQFFGREVLHPGEPARPIMRPAFDAHASRAVTAIGKSLGRAIERAATKLAGRFSKSGLAKSKFARRRL